jgi:hypothetical protein
MNKLLKKYDFYNLGLLNNEVVKIQSILLNNGYYYSIFNTPVITIDTINKD